ncbi:MAG: hypothetical protein PHV07_08015 [Oscillospiraceae bacterium]|nr:hypothetical protein [Oscillospiraceae bacterium]
MKRSKSVILSTMLIFTLCACNANDTERNSTYSVSGLNFCVSEESKTDTSKPSDIPTVDPSLYTRKINKANIYQTSETVQYDDFSFSNFKLTMSKQLPLGVTKEQVIYLGEATDAEGTLTSAQTYAFVTMNITNLTNKKQEYYLCDSNFILLDENLNFTTSFIEAHYRSGDADIKSKEYFKQTFNPNETTTYTIGYILDDTIANADNLYYLLNLSTRCENSKGYKIN